jgi:hypothetical protein
LKAIASPDAALCQKVADRDWNAVNAASGPATEPQYSPDASFTFTEDAVAQLEDWAKAQTPPFVVTPEVTEALKTLSAETGTIGALDKLPGGALYALTHEQGSAHCLASRFFVVENGHTQLVPEPRILDAFFGASCGALRSFTRIGGIPAFVQNHFTHTPSLSASMVIVTWDEKLSPTGCALTYSYAPKFGRATDLDVCEGIQCEGLRAAARELAESVQKNPTQARQRLEGQLTEALRAEYIAAVEPPTRQRGVAYELDPAEITDFVPMLLPYVYGGKLYIASIGHLMPYGTVFPDWSVKFHSATGGKRAEVASFLVGMEQGPLENISISVEARP